MSCHPSRALHKPAQHTYVSLLVKVSEVVGGSPSSRQSVVRRLTQPRRVEFPKSRPLESEISGFDPSAAIRENSLSSSSG